MQKIKVIAPEDEFYAPVDATLKKQKKQYGIDYNELAREYNLAPEGSIILVVSVRKDLQMSNVCKVLEGRGLTRYEDFNLTRMANDFEGNPIPKKEAPIALKKMSDVELKITAQ